LNNLPKKGEKMKTTRRAISIATLATLTLPATRLMAQGYPNKIIRIIVPTAAAGTGDMLARIVGDILKDSLKVAVVVDNRPGANGIIATEAAVNAAADGYTLLAASASNIAINPFIYKMPFDLEKAMMPVIQIADTTQVLIANPNFPARTVEELIAMAKAKPGMIDYASAGIGSTPHLNMELMAHMAGIKLRAIHYKGSTPGRLAVVSGEVPIMIDGLAPALPLIQSGKLRAIAVTAPKRAVALPNIPAVAEILPGYAGEIWYGVLAPAGTPAAIVDKLNEVIAAGLNSPETKAKLLAQGGQVVATPSAEFGAFITAERVKWRKVVKDSGASNE
jgi:tripartite-type tricarboxylate transporter receptor subunit TctC